MTDVVTVERAQLVQARVTEVSLVTMGRPMHSVSAAAAGPRGRGATSTTEPVTGPTHGQYFFVVADSSAFIEGQTIRCSDGTNTIIAEIITITSATLIEVGNFTITAGDPTAIAVGSPFTWEGAKGEQGDPGATGSSAPFNAIVTNGEGALTLIAGMAVYASGNGTVKAAIANAATAVCRVFGFVTDATISAAAQGNVQHTGLVTLTTAQWDAVTGQTGGLTVGPYYLDASTAGHITVTAPSASGKMISELGDALSTTQFLFHKQTPNGPIP